MDRFIESWSSLCWKRLLEVTFSDLCSKHSSSQIQVAQDTQYSLLEGMGYVCALGLFRDSTSVEKSVLIFSDGHYCLCRRQDRELKSRTISIVKGQHNLAIRLLYCSLVSWLNSYLLLAGPGSFVPSAAQVKPPNYCSPKVAEQVLPISFPSR